MNVQLMFPSDQNSYKFQYQMSRQPIKIIDSVSASELLKALTTLQKLSDRQSQFQISFCRESMATQEAINKNKQAINYQAYMANKNNMDYSTSNCKRKSVSPLGEQRDNAYKRTTNFKSRSRSPFDKSSQKTNSRISNYSKSQVSRLQSQKQNKKKEQSKKNDSHPACFQSKKILDQKQKTGISYIPIQHRAEELLREKQSKLAKLQKEKQFSKILQQKECTFKPNIIKNYKKSKVREHENQAKISQAQLDRFEQCFIDRQFLCTPTQPIVKEDEGEFSEHLFSNKGVRESENNNDTKVIGKKYKNEKFNYLLDLIH